MIVSFRPMINTGASVDAAYMNFLRCVKAACTAASGTTSLTVNPFTNNTGTIDSTTNCIVSVMANSEAGGWIESTASNVVETGTFTAIASAATFLYKFDAYNEQAAKDNLPYSKLTFHTMSDSVTGTIYHTVANAIAPRTAFANYPYVQMTYGASSSTDWTDTTYRPPSATQNSQANSYTLNAEYVNSTGAGSTSVSFRDAPAFCVNDPNRIFYIAVTANYCILWEHSTGSSYSAGYSLPLSGGFAPALSRAGNLMYGGLRATQPWEDALATNPPWVCMQLTHIGVTGRGWLNNSAGNLQSTSYGATGHNQIAASMCTYSEAGSSVTQSPTKFITADEVGATTTPFYFYENPTHTSTGGSAGSNPRQGLVPPMMGRYFGATNYYTTVNQYMPAVDSVTGVLVPSAYPIIARRANITNWNPGGAIRGMFKSLNMPFDQMKYYYADSEQTFTIDGDEYLPVVFHESMYLIRFA